MLTPKTPVCAECGAKFYRVRPLQRVCSPICASRLVRYENAVKKADFKARKAALKTIPDLIKEAQREFNKWVRTRDFDRECISCGTPPPDLSGLHAGRDAGHYRSTGAAPHLRFHEDNCHAQCVHCNQYRAGNAVDFRLGLLDRIGSVRLAAIEANNAVHKWQREELIEIKKTYAAKARALKKEMA